MEVRAAKLIAATMVFALAAPSAVAQQMKTIAGSATYRERIALPPNAVLEATLEDVSQADSPARVIGRTRVENPGHPPFQFSIWYDPSQIIDTHSYAVRARVTVDGNPMFLTDKSYPVLTGAKEKDVPMIIMRRAGAAQPR